VTVPVDTEALQMGPSAALSDYVLSDYVALTKPRITTTVIATMLAGASLARRGGFAMHPTITGPCLMAVLVATALVVGAANALNMYLERETDGLMVRTRSRPLPAGRLPPAAALALGGALAALGVPLVAYFGNATTAVLAGAALVSYVAVYTPLKRHTTLSLLVGAVPGAIPPLLGWTAVTGRIQWPGVVLFAVLFLWQVPHFLAIATFRREDYRRAGLKVLPVERGDRVTRIHIVGYSALLFGATLAPIPLGLGGRVYGVAAVVLGLVFLAVGAFGLRRSAGDRWARGLFFTSIAYLVLLLAVLVAGT
jgi:protoheme IX farnesyltransferase